MKKLIAVLIIAGSASLAGAYQGEAEDPKVGTLPKLLHVKLSDPTGFAARMNKFLAD